MKNVTFIAQEVLNVIEDEDEGLTAITEDELSNGELARVKEISKDYAVKVLGKDWENILVVEVVEAPESIYPFLWITKTGKVACADLNQPPFYGSFASLLVG